MKTYSNYIALCLHYVNEMRSSERILGNTYSNFIECIEYFITRYPCIDINNVHFAEGANSGILYTFDDGLNCHYECAKILYKYGIRGIFFIPTCIISDELPANPIIIHYSIAKYGVEKFTSILKKVIEEMKINDYVINFNKDKDDVWNSISTTKNIINYSYDWETTRKILTNIYYRYLRADYPDIMNKMHLSKSQISDMINMGHYIGVHTHNHIAITNSKNVNDSDVYRELVNPKKILKNYFNINSNIFSYPYGEIDKNTYQKFSKIINNNYEKIFTLRRIKNNINTSNDFLGRISPSSNDDIKSLILSIL